MYIVSCSTHINYLISKTKIFSFFSFENSLTKIFNKKNYMNEFIGMISYNNTCSVLTSTLTWRVDCGSAESNMLHV
jgi:hypothetical protein